MRQEPDQESERRSASNHRRIAAVPHQQPHVRSYVALSDAEQYRQAPLTADNDRDDTRRGCKLAPWNDHGVLWFE